MYGRCENNPPPQSRRRVGSLVFVRQTLWDTSKVISVQKSTQAVFFLIKNMCILSNNLKIVSCQQVAFCHFLCFFFAEVVNLGCQRREYISIWHDVSKNCRQSNADGKIKVVGIKYLLSFSLQVYVVKQWTFLSSFLSLTSSLM